MHRQFSAAFAFALLLAACSGDDNADTDTDATATATATATAGTTSTAGTTTEGTTGTESGTASGTATSTASTTAGTSTSTSGETTGGDLGMFCSEQCSADSDCQIGGVDMGFTCEGGLCQSDISSATCRTDDECIATFSGWAIPCTDDTGCPGQVCIDVDGAGFCATPPSDFLMCSDFNQSEVGATTFPGGDPVTVCANTKAVCNDQSYCFVPCGSDTDCELYPEGSKHCDVGTGFCGCQNDSECAAVPNASVCVDGSCRCAADSDCMANDYADVCNGGFCGCSSDMVCASYPQQHDGTMVGCGG